MYFNYSIYLVIVNLLFKYLIIHNYTFSRSGSNPGPFGTGREAKTLNYKVTKVSVGAGQLTPGALSASRPRTELTASELINSAA